MWWLSGGEDARRLALCHRHPGSDTRADGHLNPHSDTAAAAPRHSTTGAGAGCGSAPSGSAAPTATACLQRR
jgi:hypothetical protein